MNGDEAIYVKRTQKICSHNIVKYCNNSPIMFDDSFGYAEYKNGSYINEQTDNTKVNGVKMKKLRFGLLGNVSDNGCGVIAVYNALLPYLRKKINFNSILKSVDDKALLFGCAGTNPKTIDKYLKKQKFLKCILKFDPFANPDSINYNSVIMFIERLCKSVILLYNYSSSLLHWHYIAGVRKNGVKFKFYNANSDLKNECYSVFDCIDKLENNRTVTMMIWGIL